MTGRAIGPLAVEQLRQIYQRTAHLKPGQSVDTRKEKTRVNRRQGRLTEDLASPSAVIGAAPTTARFEFLTEGSDGQLHPTGIFNVVTNHDPGVSGSDGDYVIVQRTDGLWMLSGSGGSGGGESDCCCQCVCVLPNLEHPGGFDTTSIFTIELPRPSLWLPTTDGSGECRVKAGSYDVAWEDSSGHWDRDLTATHIEFRDIDENIATPQSASGTIVMNWPNINGRITYRFTFDAVGSPVIPFP